MENKDLGKRFNSGKTKHNLTPPFAQEQYAKVLTMGSIKYGDRNWELGMKWSTIVDSLERHLNAYKRGEDFDSESGILHSAHIMTNAAFLTEYYKLYPQGDDRNHWYLKDYRIGIDIDDVLALFIPNFCDRFKIPIPTSWNFDRKMKEKVDILSQDKEFWLSLPVKTDPKDIPFEPICYITSRNFNLEWTEMWLDKHGFPAVPVIQVGMNGSKVEAAKSMKLDMFIDDNFSNFVTLNKAGITTFLYDAPHNQRYNVGSKRIYNVKDVEWR